jgi:uncharacterized protein (TIGR03067 family)
MRETARRHGEPFFPAFLRRSPMKRGAGLILIALASWSLPASAGDKDRGDDKKELEKFQGTWNYESFVLEGKSPPPEILKMITLVIKGNDWSFLLNDKKQVAGTLTINAARKTIDSKDTEGLWKDKTWLGIYEFKGDTLKVCWAQPGEKRPTTLESKEGSKRVLAVLKRAQK